MTDMKLFFFPRSCSGVTMTALEMTGMAYDRQMVNIFKGEQKSTEYLKTVHRSGKVPALVVDGKPITENASILTMLNAMAPDAGILPRTDDPLEKAAQHSDLIWCASTLHPMVRQIRAPMRFTEDENFSGIYADGTSKLKVALSAVEERVSGGKWFYGDTFSIIDVYLLWLIRTASSAGFPIQEYPALVDHNKRVVEQPALLRALAIEEKAVETAGIEFPE